MLDGDVLRMDERLARVQWPGLEEVGLVDIERSECLLVCAGFEERAVEVARRACSDGSGFGLAVVKYRPEYRENRLGELRALGRQAGCRIEEVVYDRESPAGIGRQLCQIAEQYAGVTIDVSGMSRLLIVQLLTALLASEVERVGVAYCEADEYPPPQEQFERDRTNRRGTPSYLSSGIFEIAAAPELASVAMVEEAVRLIAFPSFDPSQFSNLIHELQPTYVDVVHGRPRATSNRWRREAIAELNADTLRGLQQRSEHEVGTLDYRETLRLLLKIYGERSMLDRLLLAPTGSKMQAVAVGVARAVLYDIQIVYPTPRVFTEPDGYTRGVRRVYRLDLPDEAKELVQRVSERVE